MDIDGFTLKYNTAMLCSLGPQGVVSQGRCCRDWPAHTSSRCRRCRKNEVEDRPNEDDDMLDAKARGNSDDDRLHMAL